MVVFILDPIADLGNYPLLTWGFKFIFLVLAAGTLIYYHRATWSDPGYIPVTLKAPTHALVKEVYDKTCEKCGNRWKPPRAYHCSTCDRCVFKMDHHCVWINNCVGAGNAKYFLQFVVCVGVYCFYFNFLMFIMLLNFVGIYGSKPLLDTLKYNQAEIVDRIYVVGDDSLLPTSAHLYCSFVLYA